MKNFALWVVLLLPAVCFGESVADLQKKFTGSWKLISMEGPNQNGQAQRDGIIMYDGMGHMSVQIFSPDRPAFPKGRAQATDKEKADAFTTYTAYYGTYMIEPGNGVVVHHLEGSITPGQIGQDNIRYFEFRGNRLILSVGNDGKGGRLARKDTTTHVTWEKLSGK
jgi:Lipocalin-like domain